MLELTEGENENTCYYKNCNKKPEFLVSFREFNDPIKCVSISGGIFKMCSEHEERSRKCKNYIKSIKIDRGDMIKEQECKHKEFAELIEYIEELNQGLPEEASLNKIITALKNVKKQMEGKQDENVH